MKNNDLKDDLSDSKYNELKALLHDTVRKLLSEDKLDYAITISMAFRAISELQETLCISKQSQAEAWTYCLEIELARVKQTKIAEELKNLLVKENSPKLGLPLKLGCETEWHGFIGEFNDPIEAGMVKGNDYVYVRYTDGVIKGCCAKFVYWGRDVPEETPYVISLMSIG